MWGGFVIRKNYVKTEKIYGCQKMNFNYQFNKKDEKSWILKTVYGKHLLIYSDFLKSSCTPEIVSLSDQVARFFGLRVAACSKSK